MPLVFSIPPENMRKPVVFSCFQRVQKETSGKKWVSVKRYNNLKLINFSQIQCLRLLQLCNFKELAAEGLDELLDSLPSTPQKWEPIAHAERDAKSMPRIIQLNSDDPPSPLPRHKKLRKVNTTGVEASDLVRLYVFVS